MKAHLLFISKYVKDSTHTLSVIFLEGARKNSTGSSQAPFLMCFIIKEIIYFLQDKVILFA